MKIQPEKCNECLFGKDKIVSKERAADVIAGCLKKDTYFVCHKATIKNKDVCCRGFWDAFKDRFNLGRIAQRLDFVIEEKVE